MQQNDPFAGWALLELMGHRRLGGYVTEQEIAGTAFLRIDIPEHPWRNGCTCGSDQPDSRRPRAAHVCQMFRAEDDDQILDIYATCLTPTTEPMARAVAQHAKPTPVQRWELQALEPAHRYVPDTDADDDDEPF